ncbi:MAG: PilW family protein [Parahaliea sp.]
MTSPLASRGLSLIEFMVAMLLGTILIGGAVSVYLASKRSYTEVERFASMSENGRFAMDVVSYSLRHVGFFGQVLGADIRPGDASGWNITNPCDGSAEVFNLAENFFVATTDTNGDALDCIDDALANTQVLVIKRVQPSPRYDADPDDTSASTDGVLSFVRSGGAIFDSDRAYVVTNTESGIVVDGADTPPAVGQGDEVPEGVAWPYVFEAYYIQNPALPTLSRKVLTRTGGQWEVITEQLVEGVERMNFRFGMDDPADPDWEVDTYTDIAGVGGNWAQVASVEVFLLLRTPEQDLSYTDNKTYQVADETYTPADNLHRLLLRSRVTLRNPQLSLR